VTPTRVVIKPWHSLCRHIPAGDFRAHFVNTQRRLAIILRSRRGAFVAGSAAQTSVTVLNLAVHFAHIPTAALRQSGLHGARPSTPHGRPSPPAGPCLRAPSRYSSQHQVDRNAPRFRLIRTRVRAVTSKIGPKFGPNYPERGVTNRDHKICLSRANRCNAYT
jgi:hypothetical protein